MVLEMIGIELADHPDGLLLGKGDLLAPGQWSDPLPATGSVIPGFNMQFEDDSLVACLDIACLEQSPSGPTLGIAGIPLRDRVDEMPMAPIDPQTTFTLEYEARRQIVYDALGILFPAEHGNMEVAQVVPDSPSRVAPPAMPRSATRATARSKAPRPGRPSGRAPALRAAQEAMSARQDRTNAQVESGDRNGPCMARGKARVRIGVPRGTRHPEELRRRRWPRRRSPCSCPKSCASPWA